MRVHIIIICLVKCIKDENVDDYSDDIYIESLYLL